MIVPKNYASKNALKILICLQIWLWNFVFFNVLLTHLQIMLREHVLLLLDVQMLECKWQILLVKLVIFNVLKVLNYFTILQQIYVLKFAEEHFMLMKLQVNVFRNVHKVSILWIHLKENVWRIAQILFSNQI